MKLGEFFVELLVDAGKGSLTVRDLIGKFGDLDAVSASVVGGLGVMGEKFAELADRAFEAAAGFEAFSSQSGLSAQELQKWQIVAEQANVSAGAVANSVMSLQKQLAEIRLGRGNIAPFQMLGISSQQSAFGVLTQLRDRLRGMDRATATNLISQMGIDPSMIQLLTLSNEKFAEFTKTISGMSEVQEKSFLRGKLAMVQFNQQARQSGYDLVAIFGPVFIRGLEASASVLYLMGKALTGVNEGLTKAPELAKLLGVSFLALAAVMAPVTATFVAVLLVLEDIATYMKGGKSLTGDVIDFMKRNGLTGQSAATTMGMSKTGVGVGSLALAGAAAYGRPMTQNTLHQEIHSTAPASEVARHAVAEHKKQISDATLQTNNGGY